MVSRKLAVQIGGSALGVVVVPGGRDVGQLAGTLVRGGGGAPIQPCPNLARVEPDKTGDVDRGESLVTKDVNLPFAAPEKPGNVGGCPERFLWFGADGFCFAHTVTGGCQLQSPMPMARFGVPVSEKGGFTP